MAVNARDASHFLRRVGFGGTSTEVAHFAGREIPDIVGEVLDLVPDLPGQPDFANLSVSSEYEAHSTGIRWWLQRMIDASWVDRSSPIPSPLQEKVALFWHDHFATGQSKVEKMHAMFQQNQLFRSTGLGDFEPLCQRVAVGGAMLRYLDNETNIVGAEQENFARELMELFTMGIGNYTENDVVEMARAWTGHNTVGWDEACGCHDATYQFYPERHDDGPKTIFGITRNWDGPETITEICQGVRRQQTARFIVRRAWGFFANTEPTDALLDELVGVYTGGGPNGGDLTMKELLRAIFEHPVFWSSYRQLVKTPTEFLVDLLRRTGRRVDDIDPRWYMGFMGQTLFDPPNVSGWGENGYWLSTATAWGRSRFAADLRWRLAEEGFFAELSDLAPADATQVVFDTFGIEQPSDVSRSSLETWFGETRRVNAEWAIPSGAVLLGALTPEFQLA